MQVSVQYSILVLAYNIILYHLIKVGEYYLIMHLQHPVLSKKMVVHDEVSRHLFQISLYARTELYNRHSSQEFFRWMFVYKNHVA